MAQLNIHALFPIVDIDDEIEVCRNEACQVIGIHAVHDVPGRSGRPPKNCPHCSQPLTVTVDEITEGDPITVRSCGPCGYIR